MGGILASHRRKLIAMVSRCSNRAVSLADRDKGVRVRALNFDGNSRYTGIELTGQRSS